MTQMSHKETYRALSVDNNDFVGNEHFAWKTRGYNDSFKRLVDLSRVESLQRMNL